MVKEYRYKIIFSYDGSNFFGYAKQINKRTIQEEIETVLSKILNEKITIYASGRTDKGVHALNQVADFKINKKIDDLHAFLNSINKCLPEDIYIKSILKVKLDFSSRFNVKSKEYEYAINYKNYNPLRRNYELFDNKIKDINLMKEYSKLFIGTHNFQNFTSKEEDFDSFKRTIYSIDIKNKKDGYIFINIKGNGFMRYEIRKIVGTLIEASKYKIDKETILYYLNSEKRNIINYTAPSKGLYLKKVRY